MSNRITRTIAHDPRAVPGEIALCAIHDGSRYALHVNSAKADRAGNVALAVSGFTRSALETANENLRKFNTQFTATDVLAAALELSIYYRRHIAESA